MLLTLLVNAGEALTAATPVGLAATLVVRHRRRARVFRHADRFGAACAQHDAVSSAYAAVVFGDSTTDTAQALADVTRPTTAAFIDAYTQANDLRPEQAPNAVTLDAYAAAVTTLETAWAAATRTGLEAATGLPHAEALALVRAAGLTEDEALQAADLNVNSLRTLAQLRGATEVVERVQARTQQPVAPAASPERLRDKVQEMSARGWSVSEIAREIGCSREAVLAMQRRTGTAPARRGTSSTAQVREWAQEQGMPVSRRGRNDTVFLDEYNQATPKTPKMTSRKSYTPSAAKSRKIVTFADLTCNYCGAAHYYGQTSCTCNDCNTYAVPSERMEYCVTDDEGTLGIYDSEPEAREAISGWMRHSTPETHLTLRMRQH